MARVADHDRCAYVDQTMPESVMSELRRYVRFGEEDEAALIAFADKASPYFGPITEHFYARLSEHEAARAVFSGPAQVNRLKGTLQEWMTLLLRGPWDDAYYERRARIGRMHVKISLPQRYMFGAMDLIRIELVEAANAEVAPSERDSLIRALHKIIDIELCIMLETYNEAYVAKVQRLERADKSRLEQQLAISEARYEEIVEKGEALIVTTDRTGTILLFNRKCEAMTGLSRTEASQHTWLELFAMPAERSALQSRTEQVMAGQPVAPYEGNLPNTGELRRVRWHFTTLPGGTEPALCAIGIDVTQEHELGVRTRRAERLAALGTMAAGLAHEIRNPLNAAHIQLTVAQRRLLRSGASEPEGVRSAVELASSEMKRLAGLVEDFLQFARPQQLKIGFADLRETVITIVTLLEPEAQAAGIELVLAPGDSLRLAFDEEKIKQVLLNLIRNAIEAAPKTGTGRVRVGVDAAHGAGHFFVEDNGPGFPQDSPIFEPFFTTKEQGTGLGLAIVHRIVSDHGGSIDVETSEGKTLFSVSLPLTRGAA